MAGALAARAALIAGGLGGAARGAGRRGLERGPAPLRPHLGLFVVLLVPILFILHQGKELG